MKFIREFKLFLEQFTDSIKLIIRIKDFDIKIITALGKNENTKKKDKIILL